MNKNKTKHSRHPLAQFLTIALTIEVLFIFVLSLLKTKIPPIFFSFISDAAFWDILAIITTVIIYAAAFPNDLSEQEKYRDKKDIKEKE